MNRIFYKILLEFRHSLEICCFENFLVLRHILKHDFNLTDDQLKKVFILPHNLAFEPYVRAVQYKILNSILYINSKL